MPVCDMQRILIVSEDAFLRDLIRQSLADMEVEVRSAVDAAQMQTLCHRVLFDLVIVLHVSPFLNGSDPVRRIRPQNLKRPLVYVLSWQQAEQTTLGLLESGVDQYITLPVSLHRLRRKVADDLNRLL